MRYTFYCVACFYITKQKKNNMKFNQDYLKYTIQAAETYHAQMDGAHAGRFLRNMQDEINRL